MIKASEEREENAEKARKKNALGGSKTTAKEKSDFKDTRRKAKKRDKYASTGTSKDARDSKESYK